jgi:hypothetical protein
MTNHLPADSGATFALPYVNPLGGDEMTLALSNPTAKRRIARCLQWIAAKMSAIRQLLKPAPLMSTTQRRSAERQRRKRLWRGRAS